MLARIVCMMSGKGLLRLKVLEEGNGVVDADPHQKGEVNKHPTNSPTTTTTPSPTPAHQPPTERNKTDSPKSLPTAPASVPANMTGNTGKIHAGVIPPTLNLLSTFLTTNNK